MSKKNNSKQVKKSNKTPEKALANTKLKQYLFALLTVVVIAGIVVGIVLLTKNKGNQEENKRFEDLTHISLKEFNALIGKSESDNDLKDLDSGFLTQEDIYVFIYNPDFDNEELESLIKRFGEDFKFNILVMNYEENKGISEQYSKLLLPDRPALIHIHLEQAITNDQIFINYREIQTALATFREGQ